MKKHFFFFLQVMFIGALFLLTGAVLSESQELSSEKINENIKISITADQVEFDPQNNMAVYKGGVTVKQDNTCLYADRVEVYWVEGEEKIELIKVYDHIKIVQEDKIITAEEGIYYHKDRKVILTGNPMTRQGKNWITGDQIIYFWDQGKVLVEGNARAVIAVEEEEKGEVEKEKVD